MKKKILVVDDEELIRLCVSLTLQMNGYDTVCLNDGLEAYRYLLKAQHTNEHVDLLICDVTMPNLSGEELIDKVLENKWSIPVLAISGYGEKELVVRLMKKGCKDFIDKPFDPQILTSCVEDVLKQCDGMHADKKRNESIQSIGQNTRQIAHDINNMLSAVIGFADTVLTDETIDYSIKNRVAKMLTATEHAADMCESIVEFSFNSNTAPVEDCNVCAAIEDVVGILSDIADTSVQIRPVVNSASLYCRVNIKLFKQVLINLGVNALQAMPEGGTVQFVLDSGVIDGKAMIKIGVVDNGCGIKPENLPKIFDEGFTTKKNGSGLGLNMVKTFIEKNNGRINVMSNDGAGTKFMLWLPLSESIRSN